MRIAIISTYPPQKDGIGIYAGHFADSFEKLGNFVRVISFQNYEYKDNRVKPFLKKHNPFGYLKTALFIKNMKFDTVIIQHEYLIYNYFWLPLMMALLKLFRIKVNLVVHTVIPYEDFVKKNIFRLIHSFTFLFTDKIFVHTENARKHLQRKTFVRKKTIVLPIPIDKKNVKPEMPKDSKVLSFGYAAHDKGIDIACNAVEGTDIKLKIVTSINPKLLKEKKYLEKIKELAEKNNNITLVQRFVSEKEKEELYKETDFCILPYRFIEQSAVLTDVWGFYKIPVCSDVRAFKEEVNDKYGVLFTKEDPEDLRKQLQAIIKDKDKQKKLLDNITKLVEERNFDAVAKDYMEYI
ncbi:MAG: glycosyltransferase [bacterium]|nr:glycosyltransferase [bacterium]